MIIPGTVTTAAQTGGTVLTVSGHVVEVGSSKLLLCFIVFNNNLLEVVDNIAWDAAGVNEAMTFLGQSTRTVNDGRIEIWYLKDPTSKTADITITLDTALTATAGFTAIAVSNTGVEQGATTFNTVATNNDSDTAPTIVVATVPGERVYGGLGVEDKDTTEISVDAPSTEIAETFGGSGGRSMGNSLANRAEVSPNVTIDWTLIGAENWATIGVSLRPAPKAVLHPSHGFLGPPYI